VVSDKQWIYWATIIPATILAVGLWQGWVSHSDAITRFVNALFKWFTERWAKVTRRNKKANKGEESEALQKVQVVGKVEEP
jgi:hypothetical protein